MVPPGVVRQEHAIEQALRFHQRNEFHVAVDVVGAESVERDPGTVARSTYVNRRVGLGLRVDPDPGARIDTLLFQHSQLIEGRRGQPSVGGDREAGHMGRMARRGDGDLPRPAFSGRRGDGAREERVMLEF